MDGIELLRQTGAAIAKREAERLDRIEKAIASLAVLATRLRAIPDGQHLELQTIAEEHWGDVRMPYPNVRERVDA